MKSGVILIASVNQYAINVDTEKVMARGACGVKQSLLCSDLFCSDLICYVTFCSMTVRFGRNQAYPFWAATISGVEPVSVLAWFGSAPRSNSALATPKWPFCDAHIREVNPANPASVRARE